MKMTSYEQSVALEKVGLSQELEDNDFFYFLEDENPRLGIYKEVGLSLYKDGQHWAYLQSKVEPIKALTYGQVSELIPWGFEFKGNHYDLLLIHNDEDNYCAHYSTQKRRVLNPIICANGLTKFDAKVNLLIEYLKFFALENLVIYQGKKLFFDVENS